MYHYFFIITADNCVNQVLPVFWCRHNIVPAHTVKIVLKQIANTRKSNCNNKLFLQRYLNKILDNWVVELSNCKKLGSSFIKNNRASTVIPFSTANIALAMLSASNKTNTRRRITALMHLLPTHFENSTTAIALSRSCVIDLYHFCTKMIQYWNEFHYTHCV